MAMPPYVRHPPAGEIFDFYAEVARAADPLPVILVSSDAGATSVMRRARGGAVCVLSKPLDAELLELALFATPKGSSDSGDAS